MGQMYFGTRGQETWVKAPAVQADFSRKKYSNTTEFTNGGVGIVGSIASHAEYNMTYNVATRDQLRAITDYAQGIFSGDLTVQPLIYFLDPMEMDKNLASISWGFGASACADAPSLIIGQKPSVVVTAANSNRYPVLSAQYTISATGQTYRSLYIPLPTGYTLWAGAHGSATGTAAITATPVGGAATNLPWLAPPSTTLAGTSFSGASGVVFSFGGAGTATFAGLVIQVLKTGATPANGNYISPQGHSGCNFDDYPTEVALYSGSDQYAQVNASWKLVEVGAWQS